MSFSHTGAVAQVTFDSAWEVVTVELDPQWECLKAIQLALKIRRYELSGVRLTLGAHSDFLDFAGAGAGATFADLGIEGGKLTVLRILPGKSFPAVVRALKAANPSVDEGELEQRATFMIERVPGISEAEVTASYEDGSILKDWNLSGLDLTELPPEMGSLLMVGSLNLGGNCHLQVIPEKLGDIRLGLRHTTPVTSRLSLNTRHRKRHPSEIPPDPALPSRRHFLPSALRFHQRINLPGPFSIDSYNGGGQRRWQAGAGK